MRLRTASQTLIRPKTSIESALTGATGRNEIFQNIQTFTVVGTNGHLDGVAGGVCQQAAHAGQLLDLVHRTTSTGVCHHIDLVVLGQVVCQSLGDLIGGSLPDGDGLVVTLVVGDQAAVEQLADLCDLLVSLSDQFLLLRRDHSVAHSDGDCRQSGVLVALRLDGIQHLCTLAGAVAGHAAGNDVGQSLLGHAEADLVLQPVLGISTVDITQILRNRVIEDDAADGGFHQTGALHAVNGHGAAHLDGCVQGDDVLGVLFIAVILAFLVLVGRITYINVTKGSKYTKLVLNQKIYDSKTIPYKRGDILDRNGTKIATSERVYNVILDVVVMTDKEEYIDPTIKVLNKCFGISEKTVREIVEEKPNSRYIVLKKGIDYETAQKYNEIKNDTKNYPNVKGIWLPRSIPSVYE